MWDSRQKDRLPTLISKQDLEKAYDRVDWKFLQSIELGLGKNGENGFRRVSSALISIMINGSPKTSSRLEGGLDRGLLFPLSYFL